MSDNVRPLTGRDRVAMMAPVTDAEALEGEQWPEALPLDAAEAPAPFPIHALPEPVRTFVEGSAEAMRTMPDILATFVLAACSTVTGGRFRVHMDTYSEPVVLHTLAVGEPGTLKSPAMKLAVAPLVELNRELRERHGPEVAEAEQRRRIETKRLEDLERSAVKADAPRDRILAEGLAADLLRDIESRRVPVVPQLFTSDATPEAIEVQLDRHGGIYAWLDSEGGLFLMMGGRYSSKGTTGAIDVFLKGWSGDSINVDRLGREPLDIPSTALTIGIATQPGHLRESAPLLIKRGVTARMLICYPDLPQVDRSQPGCPLPDGEPYASTLHRIYERGARFAPGEPHTLPLDPDALDVWRSFCAWTTDARQTGGDLHGTGLLDFGAKLDGQAARVAAIFALIEDPRAISVNAVAMERAVQVVRYYADHARRVYREIGILPEMAETRRCWQAIMKGRAGSERFEEWPRMVTTREVLRAVRGTEGMDAITVKAALARLAEEYHLIRPLEPESGGPGRKKERWEIHPDYRPTP